jgi:hypothetical protein
MEALTEWQRMEETIDGRVIVWLERQLSDGTIQRQFSEDNIVERVTKPTPILVEVA